MKETWINGRWPLMLPDHRADRPEWAYWEATRLAAMHCHIEPGDVVYDVGAEAGDFSALFATWGAEVVLVEPNPKAWPTIRATFEGNSLRVPAWLVALLTDTDPYDDTSYGNPGDWTDDTPDIQWDRAGMGWPECTEGPMDPAHGFAHIGEGDCDAVTLDWMGGKPDGAPRFPVPDVITMDVEGGEAHVIRGAVNTLVMHRPTVFMSVHPQFMADLYGEHPNQIHDTMRSLGYHGRFLGEDHEQHWVFAHPDKRPFPGAAEEYYIPGNRIIL